MATSDASTVTEYLAALPPERRQVVSAVRDLVRKHLPEGYAESMGFGMISYTIPRSRYPDTYNTAPLVYAAIAAQKNYYAIYLMGIYGDSESAKQFKQAFARAGKKLDMGKSCVRFKALEDLDLPAIGNAIAAIPVDDYIAFYEKSRPPKKTTKSRAAKKA